MSPIIEKWIRTITERLKESTSQDEALRQVPESYRETVRKRLKDRIADEPSDDSLESIGIRRSRALSKYGESELYPDKGSGGTDCLWAMTERQRKTLGHESANNPTILVEIEWDAVNVVELPSFPLRLLAFASHYAYDYLNAKSTTLTIPRSCGSPVWTSYILLWVLQVGKTGTLEPIELSKSIEDLGQVWNAAWKLGVPDVEKTCYQHFMKKFKLKQGPLPNFSNFKILSGIVSKDNRAMVHMQEVIGFWLRKHERDDGDGNKGQRHERIYAFLASWPILGDLVAEMNENFRNWYNYEAQKRDAPPPAPVEKPVRAPVPTAEDFPAL